MRRHDRYEPCALCYNVENRLVSVTPPAAGQVGPSVSATFVYDTDGNGVESTFEPGHKK